MKKSLLLLVCSMYITLSAAAGNPVRVSPTEGTFININQPFPVKVAIHDNRATRLVARVFRNSLRELVYETTVPLMVGADTVTFSIVTFNMRGSEENQLELTTYGPDASAPFLGRSYSTLLPVGRPPFPPIGPLVNDLPALIAPGYYQVAIQPNNPEAVRMDVKLVNSLSLQAIYETTVYFVAGIPKIVVGLLTHQVEAGKPYSVDMVSYDSWGNIVGRSSYPIVTQASPLYLLSPADHSAISVSEPVEVKVALNVPQATWLSVKLIRNTPRMQAYATTVNLSSGTGTLDVMLPAGVALPGEQYLLELTAYASLDAFPLKQMYYTFFTSSLAGSRVVTAQTSSNLYARPNPFTDELLLDIASMYTQAQIRLFAQDGRIVAEKQAMGGTTVSFRAEGLAAGLYIVQLYDTEGHFEQLKVVKQHTN